jgi:hypothetical protein
MSSVAVATTAFAGLSADAQEKASMQKAEHDRFSERTAKENRPLSLVFFAAPPTSTCFFALVNGFATVKLISYYSFV